MPTAPPAAAPPEVLASQILKHFGQVLARYRQAVPKLDCHVGQLWQAKTGSSLADFPAWLADTTPQRALVKVSQVLNAPLASSDRPIGAERGAEVLLQMALLALVKLLAQRYAVPLHQSAGPLLHLPMLQDTVLALLVACRYGVAVRMELRHDSEKGEHLVVTNLITELPVVVVGVNGVRENIDIERRRLLLAQKVLHTLLPANSGLLGQHLPDDQLRAWVDDAHDDGLPPIVVLSWDEADVARDIEQRWGVRTAMRGDPATLSAGSLQRTAALQFADAGMHVEPHFADLARLLRRVPVAPVAAQPAKPLVFISYARENAALLKRLCIFLDQHNATISTWTDQELEPGQRWKQKLLERLAGCQVAVLLLSADFNASPFVNEVEMPEIKRRHEAREAIVVPVVAGPCNKNFFPWVATLQFGHPPETALPAPGDLALDHALNDIAAVIARLATQATKDPHA